MTRVHRDGEIGARRRAFGRLRLRGHAAAERFSARDQRQAGAEPRGLRYRRPDRRMGGGRAVFERDRLLLGRAGRVGDVVGDDSYFAFERYGEGWSQDDLKWEWGAPVSALTINDNVIFVSMMPADRPGDKAFVTVTPYADYFRLDNRIAPERIFKSSRAKSPRHGVKGSRAAGVSRPVSDVGDGSCCGSHRGCRRSGAG